MTSKPIYVSQPKMPPLEEFIPYLEQIWDSKILSNNGTFNQSLEDELCAYFNVDYVSLFSSGTTALTVALRALNITGEVITTPYSFVATSHALMWNNLKPVFVDIDGGSLNLNPKNIEASINKNTSAIMPVHCYGYPCDVEAIKKIALKHDLKVIYDAAHAFGIEDHGGSILRHGDVSVVSFHATKVFNTFEGGAVVCSCPDLKQRIDSLKNFGYIDELTINEVGFNGKMSEINAAFGLLQLKYVEDHITRRKVLYENYFKALENLRGLKYLKFTSKFKQNYSYFPILVTDEFPLGRDELLEFLGSENIHCRRYFHPLISEFNVYKDLVSESQTLLPNASEASKRILCLPIYPNLEREQQERIIDAIRRASR